MNTCIYKDYEDFLRRSPKESNGVSQEFADANPEWNEATSNTGCWNCKDCKMCKNCRNCTGCASCRDCSDCVNCEGCYDCESCKYCSDSQRLEPGSEALTGFAIRDSGAEMDVPVIPNIHAKVLAAVRQPDALDMSDWHTCDTTHCRAGWVTHLAGEAGMKLEDRTSTAFAAMMIYRASSPIAVPPVRFFYESDKDAMKDMERCAAEEAAQ